MVILVCISGPQEIDEYDLVDPVDVLAPLEKSGFWEGVVSPWFMIVETKFLCMLFISISFN